MSSSYLGNAGTFLISTLFGLVILVVMLRFMLQCVRGDYYNPVSQFLVKATNPMLAPIRRIVPGLWGLDMAAVLLMVALQYVELLLTMLIIGQAFNPLGLLFYAVVELVRLLYFIFLFSLIIQAVMSWVQPGGYNPVLALLQQLNEPLLRPARRLAPPISGFDLSLLVVLIVLQLISILLIAPLNDLAIGLTVGRIG